MIELQFHLKDLQGIHRFLREAKVKHTPFIRAENDVYRCTLLKNYEQSIVTYLALKHQLPKLPMI